MVARPSHLISYFSSFDGLNMIKIHCLRACKTISSLWRRHLLYCLTYLDMSTIVYMLHLLYQDWPCLIEFNSINMPPYLFFVAPLISRLCLVLSDSVQFYEWFVCTVHGLLLLPSTSRNCVWFCLYLLE